MGVLMNLGMNGITPRSNLPIHVLGWSSIMYEMTTIESNSDMQTNYYDVHLQSSVNKFAISYNDVEFIISSKIMNFGALLII